MNRDHVTRYTPGSIEVMTYGTGDRRAAPVVTAATPSAPFMLTSGRTIPRASLARPPPLPPKQTRPMSR